jgi:hypothetical protein
MYIFLSSQIPQWVLVTEEVASEDVGVVIAEVVADSEVEGEVTVVDVVASEVAGAEEGTSTRDHQNM